MSDYRSKRVITPGGQGYEDRLQAIPDSAQAMDDDALVQEWMRSKRSHHTQRTYEASATRFRDFVGKPLIEVTTADVQRFLASLSDMAVSTQQRHIASIKSLIAYGHDVGALPRDVARRVKAPMRREALAERILSEQDVQAMIEGEPDARNRLVLRTLYLAGLRVAELCGLCWRDVIARGDGAQLTVFGKGSKTRFVLIPGTLYREMVDVLPQGGPLDHIFPIEVRQVERNVKAAAVRAGLSDQVSPHWLRHSHATHALEKGCPIHLLQATLGHSSIATTSKYLHARPNDSSSRYLG